MKSTLNSIIDSVTGEPGRDYLFVSRAKIIEIARTYAASPEVKEKLKPELFGAGYKQGYTHRSDEIYDNEHHAMWEAYVNELKDEINTEEICLE